MSRNRISSECAAHAGTSASPRSVYHPACFVCGPDMPLGLRMVYRPAEEDAVICSHTFGADWEGYPGYVHGGIVAAALDGAMTNWLLAHGQAGVTAELKVRYRHPVAIDVPVGIESRLQEKSGPIFVMRAQLRQNGQLAATAEAKFISNASSDKITRGHA